MNHRDIRRWVLFVLALCLLITAILLLIAPQLVLPFLLSALLWNAVSAALIHLVNRRIRTLSDQLMRVYSNSLHTDIRDNEEGALSILRNDIYKITRTFHEQQKQSEKDRLFLSDTISDISHQLRTPLTSMRMMNELLQQDLPEAQRQEFFSCVNQQLDRLEWLVSSLLKLSKLDVGTVEMKRERVSIRSLTEKAAEPLRIPAELKEQTLTLDGPDDAFFPGDFGWTAEALLNVIKNCVEHTPPGGGVRVEWSDNPLYAEIRIQDTGEGIDKSDLPHIFTRFYRGKNAGEDSVGIGLAMAKSILTRQGGEITAVSEPGKGTLFRIRMYKTVI